MLDAEMGPEAKASPGSHGLIITRTKREHYTFMDEMWREISVGTPLPLSFVLEKSS